MIMINMIKILDHQNLAFLKNDLYLSLNSRKIISYLKRLGSIKMELKEKDLVFNNNWL